MMKRCALALLFALSLSACADDAVEPGICDDPASTDPSCVTPDPCDDPESTDPSCAPACVAPQTLCGSSCVELDHDALNCGQCGTICGDEQLCDFGTCVDLPPVVVSVPADGAVNVAIDSAITLTFSQEIAVSSTWYTLDCSRSGELAAQHVALSGSGLVVTLTLALPFAYEETCMLTLLAGEVLRGVDGQGGPLFEEDVVITFSMQPDPLRFYDSFDNFEPSPARPAGALRSGWSIVRNHWRVAANNVSYVSAAWVQRTELGPAGAGTLNGVAMSTSWFDPAGQADDWMFTPAIALPSVGDCTLSWRGRISDPSYPDGYEVRVLTSEPTVAAGLAEDPIDVISAETSTWTSREVSLEDFLGESVYIAFRNHSDDKFILMVDDVTVDCPL